MTDHQIVPVPVDELERLRADAARLEWCLPILTAAGDLGDQRAMRLGYKFLSGLDGKAAIDAAMAAERLSAGFGAALELTRKAIK